MRRNIARWVIAALLLGMLSTGEYSTGYCTAKEEGDTLAGDTESGNGADQEEYGLHNPTIGENGVVTWDCVYFGSYWQEDTNGDERATKKDEKQPIKWRVLSVNGDDAFLLADKGLDCQKYNDGWTSAGVTWEECTMRSWLNGYGAEANEVGKDYSGLGFINDAFSETEQSAIRITDVVNNDSDNNYMHGGSNTLDKVYLLSVFEALHPAMNPTEEPGYLDVSDHAPASKIRMAKNTKYAKTRGAKTSLVKEYAGKGSWWLRSGGDWDKAVAVDCNGEMYRYGRSTDYYYPAVRPVLHLNLSAPSDGISPIWSYAGAVTSEGEEIGTPAPTNTPKPSNKPIESYGLHNPVIDGDDITTWDCVYFGRYPQESGNDEKQPIKWRVLSVDGDDAFLLADKILSYRELSADVDFTWESCRWREWLNGSFLDEAFTEDERLAIRTTNVVNDSTFFYDSEKGGYDVSGGNDTIDKVYLLSLDEVLKPQYGFSSDDSKDDEKKRAKDTELMGGKSEKYAGNGNWMLRSPGYIFEMWGTGYKTGMEVTEGGVCKALFFKYLKKKLGIRPVLHLNLKGSSDTISGSNWSYAGVVTSEDKAIETATPTPAGTVKPAESPEPPTVTPVGTLSPVESKKPDTESTAEPNGTATGAPGESPNPAESHKPDADSTAAPSGTVTARPGESESPLPVESKKPDAGSITAEPSPLPVENKEPDTPGITAPTAVSVRKAASLKLKQKKQTVTVSWKKVSGVDGYQVCYSTSKRWKKKIQKLTTEAKIKVKKLKKKKTYYFRVRAYQWDGAKKVYGEWSNTKKIRIRK